ncbi:MAG: hypothetical protein F4Y80_11410 [Caldilineaceae bacterium SB0665_bin_21]|nr:hypothetical protein [Caldilineaceae bacterium SB0665_bin_21]MYC61269.1 hypothetical protein [Caldilineaceae bacterium SB0661_bin_34]
MNGKWRAARILLGLRLHWWLILISVVPSFAPVLRPDPFIPGLAHLETWRYSVLQLELDAAGYALARLVNERPRAWTDRERREFVRRYASHLEARWQANEGSWLASQLLDPFDYVNYYRYDAKRLEEDAWLGLHRNELELVVQFEVMEELARLGLVSPGRVFPPVVFRLTDPPILVTYSPRDVIQTIGFAYVRPSTPWAQADTYEDMVLTEHNLSAHLSRVGGIATYPTSVNPLIRDLEYLYEVVAHEWIHTWLVFRPLGIRYLQSDDLRTINETVATIFGEEMGRRIMLRYYPELIGRPPPATMLPIQPDPMPEEAESGPGIATGETDESESESGFDFQDAMRETRLETDRLLAEGLIEDAEVYMEARRQYINAHGYFIRKLNQAYFAFHGTYATTGGSSSDLGPILEELRRLSPDLRTFMNTTAGLSSRSQLEQVLDAARHVAE